MTFWVATVLLTILWAAIGGSFSVPNLLLGAAAATLSLAIVRQAKSAVTVTVRPLPFLRLAGFFLKELLLSALRVAVLAIRPTLRLRPAIFAFPLTVRRDFEITLLANMITLTPGTLSVDVSDDRSTLYVHAIDCTDPVAARRDIADGFERRILEAFPA